MQWSQYTSVAVLDWETFFLSEGTSEKLGALHILLDVFTWYTRHPPNSLLPLLILLSSMTMKFSLARDSGRISIRVQYVPSVRNASHDGYNAELAIEASVDHGSRGNGPPTTGSQDDLSEGESINPIGDESID